MKRRNPVVAFVLSFLAPGLGHFYLGRAGAAFGLAAVFCVAVPALTAAWATLRFSPLWLGIGYLLFGPVFRLAAATWAATSARPMTEFQPKKWQRPLGYGVFFMVSVATVFNLSSFVDRRFARRYQMPSNALAPDIQPGDGMWILRTGPSAFPKKGMRVAFAATDPRRPPYLVVVSAVGGDKVEVRPEGVFINGDRRSDAFGSKVQPEVVLREGQVFGVSPGKSRDPAILDSRDVGPLLVGDYLGEIALVDSPSARGIIPWANGRWLGKESP